MTEWISITSKDGTTTSFRKEDVFFLAYEKGVLKIYLKYSSLVNEIEFERDEYTKFIKDIQG